MANTKYEDICEKQEIAMGQFKEMVVTHKKEIEDVLNKRILVEDEIIAAERLTPWQVVFTRKGECAIYFNFIEDAEDMDEETRDGIDPWDIVLSLFPKWGLYEDGEYDFYVESQYYEPPESQTEKPRRTLWDKMGIFTKKKPEPAINSAFGEMEEYGIIGQITFYKGKWFSKERLPFMLWDKTHYIRLCVEAGTVSYICEEQEMALGKFKETVAARRKEIEDIITGYFGVDDERAAAERFTPTHVRFNKKAECIIEFTDEEQGPVHALEGCGFEVLFFPEFSIKLRDP